MEIRDYIEQLRAKNVLVACFTQGLPVLYTHGSRSQLGTDVMTVAMAQDIRRYLQDSRPNEYEALERLGWAQWDEVYEGEVVRITLSADHLGARLVVSRTAGLGTTLDSLGVTELAPLVQRPGLTIIVGPGHSARRTTMHALFDVGMKTHAIGAIVERGLSIRHDETTRRVLHYEVGEFGFPHHVASYGEGVRAASASHANLIALDGVNDADDIDAVCRAAEEGATVLLRVFGRTTAHGVQALLRSANSKERVVEALSSGAALRAFPRQNRRIVVAEMVRFTEGMRKPLLNGETNLHAYIGASGILIDDALQKAAGVHNLSPDEVARASVFR